MIPPRVIALMRELAAAGWTGHLQLDFKNGRITGMIRSEKERLDA